ncbi:MAG: 2-C-methyl-D-erythritol 4-phosphate cytidylyltransferase [Bacteroidota bacterium]|nr:2-C-methyl-D-erythritol 4-phosphate cytidylyltransferase [Bacteroidota bacterium]MDE2833340.1 2-C-methyl-D-erythritol 4-phosphate cytidylyltransferase [Bacteroidota bacterium]
MGRVCVVIPAAGEGTRMGGPPKQFNTLGDSPLLYQTAWAFECHNRVDDIVVAAPADTTAHARHLMSGISKLVRVVAGGATRQESVAAGLAAAPRDSVIVLVHDAARPFIEAAAITEVIAAVVLHGAAALAVPVADTVRYAEGGFFTGEASRRNLFAVQTPQGFRRSLLAEAFESCVPDGAATDEVALVRACGHAVARVPGRAGNFKITTGEDWHRAERRWPAFARRNYES